MPEHMHLLLWPTKPIYDISNVLHSIKQSVSKQALIFVSRQARSFLVRMEDRQPNGKVHYRFWQGGGGYDRNVVVPAVVYHEMEYLHNNPVRRGLSQRAEDWPWSSAADFAGIRSGPLRLDRESLPVLRQDRR
jgi:putative transposase